MKRAVIGMSSWLVLAAPSPAAGAGGPAWAPARTLRAAEPGSPRSRQLTSRAAAAEIGGNPQESLRLADEALSADGGNPWAHYARAAALSRLGQTDRAVQAFVMAEQRFSPNGRWARSIAIYGRAHALDQAGRCAEATAAFGEYAAFVQRDDERSAELARRYASACGEPRPRAPAPPPRPAP